MTVTTESVLGNLRMVTPNGIVHGSLSLRGDTIHAIDSGAALPAHALDGEGDLLLPGLVELHTDGLEKHLFPRPGVAWPMRTALIAHDAQLLSAGITTVLDAVAIGDYGELIGPDVICTALNHAHDSGLLRVDHHLHLRCELPHAALLPTLLPLLDQPRLRLLSLMDHTPGQRQFHNLEKYRRYYGRHGMQWDDDEFARFVDERRQLQQQHTRVHADTVARLANGRGVTLASHDDGEVAHVHDASTLGVTVAEFPITLEAARAAADAGLTVLAGAPNLVCGGSHAGNVAVKTLVQQGVLHVLSSDYAPMSLLHGVFLLERLGWSLQRAVACASAVPARAVGFQDRGMIAPGMRADLLRVRMIDGEPLVVAAWIAGKRAW